MASRRCWLFSLLFFCLLSPATRAQQVIFEFPNLPGAIAPIQNVGIDFDWVKPVEVEERLLVFRLRVRRANDHVVLRDLVLDNNGAGYSGSSGSLSLNFTSPSASDGPVYFDLHAVPWSMNRQVMEKLQSYPTDGTWTYLWSGGGYGVTQNIYYKGSLIAPKPAGDTTYCSGVAFEVAVVGYQDYNTTLNRPADIGTLTASQMNTFRQRWYGTNASLDPELKLAALAIPLFNLGTEVTGTENVQPGDFVQLWRHNGSGHNPIFIGWIKNGSGAITGMRYWGSQPSTNGIGYRNESFGTSGSSMDINRTFYGRMRKPRDEADFVWSLGSKDTQDAPTQIGFNSGWFLY